MDGRVHFFGYTKIGNFTQDEDTLERHRQVQGEGEGSGVNVSRPSLRPFAQTSV